jgi:hypothetical protein
MQDVEESILNYLKIFNIPTFSALISLACTDPNEICIESKDENGFDCLLGSFENFENFGVGKLFFNPVMQLNIKKHNFNLTNENIQNLLKSNHENVLKSKKDIIKILFDYLVENESNRSSFLFDINIFKNYLYKNLDCEDSTALFTRFGIFLNDDDLFVEINALKFVVNVKINQLQDFVKENLFMIKTEENLKNEEKMNIKKKLKLKKKCIEENNNNSFVENNYSNKNSSNDNSNLNTNFCCNCEVKMLPPVNHKNIQDFILKCSKALKIEEDLNLTENNEKKNNSKKIDATASVFPPSFSKIKKFVVDFVQKKNVLKKKQNNFFSKITKKRKISVEEQKNSEKNEFFYLDEIFCFGDNNDSSEQSLEKDLFIDIISEYVFLFLGF